MTMPGRKGGKEGEGGKEGKKWRLGGVREREGEKEGRKWSSSPERVKIWFPGNWWL